MRMKKLAVLLLATALSCGSAMSSFAASWIAVGDNNWKYQNDNGSYVANTWVKHTDGMWYYLGSDTMMKKGWFQNSAGKWYFLNANGAMQTGLIIVNHNAYYMNDSGELFEGNRIVQGKNYQFTVNGTTNGQPYTPYHFASNGAAISTDGSILGDDSSDLIFPPVAPGVVTKTDQTTNTVTTEVKDNHKESIKDIAISKPVPTAEKMAEIKVDVKLTPEAMKTPEMIADTKAAVEYTMNTILADIEAESPVSVVIPGMGTVTKKASAISQSDIDRWVTPAKLAELQAQGSKPVSLSVVIDDVTVVYRIDIK